MSNQFLSFQIALDPTPEQLNQLSSHVGAVRYAYNWCISQVEQNWGDVKEGRVDEYIGVSFYSLRKSLNEVKADIAPWYVENSKEAFSTGCNNASEALKNWFRGRKTGQKVGFPRYKKKHLDSGTGCAFSTGTRRLEKDNRHLTLPNLGTIRLHERQKTLRWLLENGATIGTVTVSWKKARWFASVLVKASEELAIKYFDGRYKVDSRRTPVGYDLGLKVFLTSSDGKVIENPRFLRNSLKKLKKAQKTASRRQRPSRKTGEAGSKRYEIARKRVEKLHARVANQRSDFLHKQTYSDIIKHELIALENLNVSGMIKNKHLSLSIADAGWFGYRRQLEYKSLRVDSKVIYVGRFYPSSKTCSECGTVKAKLSLSERTYSCAECGFSLNRDHNAARNILKQAVAQSCGETLNGRGDGSSGPRGETTVREASSQDSLDKP